MPFLLRTKTVITASINKARTNNVVLEFETFTAIFLAIFFIAFCGEVTEVLVVFMVCAAERPYNSGAYIALATAGGVIN